MFQMGKPSSRLLVCWGSLLVGIFFALGGEGWGKATEMPPLLKVDDNGTVHVPATAAPVSEYLSPEGKAYLAEHLKLMQHPEMLVQPNGIPPFLAGYLARQKILYPVDRQETTIGGVHAYVYTPRNGVAAKNAKRVLIDLHGGGFHECWPACGELEIDPDRQPGPNQGGQPRLSPGAQISLSGCERRCRRSL